jgi:hypothetical protein
VGEIATFDSVGIFTHPPAPLPSWEGELKAKNKPETSESKAGSPDR